MVKSFKIILDTNFLLTSVRYKIHALQDISERIPSEFFILSGTIGELDGLSRENKKLKTEANIVKQMLKSENIKSIQSTMENVDNELVSKSKEYIIATNDKKLRQKIHAAGGKSIYVKKLTMVDLSEIIN